MRTKLLYLIFLCCFSLSAQQNINTSFGTQMSTTFANLDKSKIPYGILSDFSMDFTSLPAFQGTLNDSSHVHPGTLKQLYKTLLFSRVNTNAQGFVPYTTFESNWENARKKNTIVLSGLFYRYSKFLDNAYPNKITVTNNKIYDKFVNGIWQNPYEPQKAFAISPSTINYKSLKMLVKFPANLWFSNSASQVQTVQVNFGDGYGYKNLNPGQETYVHYSTPGVKTWTYKLSLSTGEVLYSHSKIVVEEGIVARPYGSKQAVPGGNGIGVVDTIGISATTAYLGKLGKATILINYGNTVGEIRKPLIVVEGLDFGNVTSPEEPFGESDIKNFLTMVDRSFSNQLQTILINDDNLPNDQEYDIIYVNWSNGTDYIQRNAFVLQEVIKWVNSVKLGTEKNVVLGQSMGGVIARYALKNMEDYNHSHDTRTYISQDSPHLGANIPLGYQHAARHGRNQYLKSPFQLLAGEVIVPLFNDGVAVSDYLGILDQPAVKQLLVQRIDFNHEVDNFAHQQWQTELKNKGYPQQTRNVAISNGSQCAITQGFSPNSNLLTINGRIKTGWLTDLLTTFTPEGIIKNNSFFLSLSAFTFEPGFLFGLLPGNSKLNANINIKALPAYGESKQIYNANITYTKKLLFLFDINNTITSLSKNSPINTIPYDYLPGGVSSTGIPSSSLNRSNSLYGLRVSVTSDPDFSLIPTISALDIGKGNTSLNTADFLVKYGISNPPISPKDSPFVNFITSYQANPFVIENSDGSNILNYNQRHLNLFILNGNWLANEIENTVSNNAIDCKSLCDVVTIAGNSNLCSSQTYSVQSGNNPVFWTASSNIVSLSNSTTGQVVVTPVSSSNQGNVTLTAIITTPNCGSVTLTKEIIVGPPILNYDPNEDFTMCRDINTTSNNFFPVMITGDDASTTWQVERITTNHYVSMQGNEVMVSLMYTAPYNYIAFRVRASNSCGYSEWLEYYVAVMESCGSGDINNYTVYPNPASDVLNIKSKKEKDKIDKDIFYEIYSFEAKIIEKGILGGNQSIDVSKYKKGRYILKIKVNGKTETHHIIIE